MEKIAFLGCSRGLGRETILAWDHEIQAFAYSRNHKKLMSLSDEVSFPIQSQSFDFSKVENLEQLAIDLEELQLDRLFYFAGGGPYGPYVEKKWRDHQWALQVSFLTPAFLLHRLTDIKQMIFIGSMVADSGPDPRAASYAAAKHGLKGLISSLVAEGDARDLRLYRPGYMDTEMLPPNATPRLEGQKIGNPKDVAKVFVEWAQNPKGEALLSLDS